MVVLALTGFSSGRSHGSRSDHSSDGGGCSSSRQDHDGSTPVSASGDGETHTGKPSSGATYRSQPTHRSTSTTSPSASTSRPLKNGTAVLVRCASADDPYATVEVSNPNAREVVFTAKISFKDRNGFTLIDTTNQVSVPAKSRKTLRVAVSGAGGSLDEVDHCEVHPTATADW
ncbi:hypothetical protein ABZ642_28360 [Streptomyces sp. NPDC007157]|uniref:hypothetical protein n=1 Tax=Streptomyces sp. NPDC007157 TaxID=3154681 RepID=UPI0033E29885